jgi:LSD1 subclass zinc finger protein
VATAEAGTPVETRFPCPTCGAVLRYLPGTDQIRCAHCGHQSAILPGGTPIEELDYDQAAARLRQAAPAATEERTVKCQGCAAEFSFDADIHADDCPYCGSAIVLESEPHKLIKPQALIPFALDEPSARDRLQGWLRSLWFAPSGVRKYARGEGRMTGVYVPYWTFDASTQSAYVGQRGTVYHEPRTVTVRDAKGRTMRQQRMVTKIRWSPARGRVARRFDDVLVLASRTLPYDLTSDLTPWLQEALRPYQEEYLAGFRSEAYQLELEPGFEQATQEMAMVIQADVMRDIGGDAQRIHDVDTRLGEISFKHILLPVWVAGYRYSGKAYQFVVNGQTGEVQGERPYSVIKIAIAVIIFLILAVTLVLVADQAGLIDETLPMLSGELFGVPGGSTES